MNLCNDRNKIIFFENKYIIPSVYAYNAKYEPEEYDGLEKSELVSVRVSASLCVHVYVVCGFYCVCFCLLIHCYYVLKNPCEGEKSLLGILSLESQTSLRCN